MFLINILTKIKNCIFIFLFVLFLKNMLEIIIGLWATILPGLTIGKYVIVGASSVVTKDVPDYAVVVCNEAKVVKYLCKEKFGE